MIAQELKPLGSSRRKLTVGSKLRPSKRAGTVSQGYYHRVPVNETGGEVEVTPVIGPFDHEENGAFLNSQIDLATRENLNLKGSQRVKKEFRARGRRAGRYDRFEALPKQDGVYRFHAIGAPG